MGTSCISGMPEYNRRESADGFAAFPAKEILANDVEHRHRPLPAFLYNKDEFARLTFRVFPVFLSVRAPARFRRRYG